MFENKAQRKKFETFAQKNGFDTSYDFRPETAYYRSRLTYAAAVGWIGAQKLKPTAKPLAKGRQILFASWQSDWPQTEAAQAYPN